MHALAQLCVRRPVFATMLILSLVVVGIFSYFSLGVDLFPKVDIPTVPVTVSDPGASPEEIETEITKKVEDAVNTISQIDEVRSISSEGQSRGHRHLPALEERRRGRAGSAEQGQPDRHTICRRPRSSRWCRSSIPTPRPILQIAVSAPRSLRDLTLIADKLIKQKLENAKGVGEITIVGGAQARDSRAGGSRSTARLQPHHHRCLQRAARSRIWNCPAAA